MTRYSSSGMNNCGHYAINEFKTFVREAHKHGIEVSNLILGYSLVLI
jgi:isoamylase